MLLMTAFILEIKAFLNPSAIAEFHTMLGQFPNYK